MPETDACRPDGGEVDVPNPDECERNGRVMVSGFSIEQVPIPSSLDAPGGADFVASVEVRNASEARGYGSDEVAYPAEELLPEWLDPYQPKLLWVARSGERVVARGVLEWQLAGGADAGGAGSVGWIDVDVHPEAEHRGIGRALADTIEATASDRGLTRLITYAVSPDRAADDAQPATRLAPPTGFGSVAALNREVRFLLARGYRLEQVERASRFALPADSAHLAELRATAQRAAGDDYVMHLWRGPTPAPLRADLARLLTRMSTDAPTAGLEEPEDPWSPERLAAAEQLDAAGPRLTLTAAVEHLSTGRLVAFSQLAVPADVARPVSQLDTLVLREHRGHRLGMLVKTANLQFLAETSPGHPSVLTWNAEENRPMLAVNEALGFVVMGYEGAWRLDL